MQIYFLYCLNKKKNLLLKNKNSKKFKNLVFLLADDVIVGPNPNFPNAVFQFTQATNYLTKNAESYLEYTLWFLEQIGFFLLTPVCFR